MVFGGMLMGTSGSVPGIVGTQTTFDNSAAARIFTVAVVVDGSSAMLAVPFCWCRNSDPGIPTATYNGVAMTSSIYVTDTVSSINDGCGIFTLVNPPAGTHNLVVTFSSNVDQFSINALNIGSISTSPINQTGSTTGGHAPAGSLSTSLLTTQPNLILCCMAVGRVSGSPTYTADSGTSTLRTVLNTGGSGTAAFFFGYRTNQSSGTFGVGATCSYAATATLVALAIAG